jgi:hypothetical protein
MDPVADVVLDVPTFGVGVLCLLVDSQSVYQACFIDQAVHARYEAESARNPHIREERQREIWLMPVIEHERSCPCAFMNCILDHEVCT